MEPIKVNKKQLQAIEEGKARFANLDKSPGILQDIEFVTPAEKEDILRRFNDTRMTGVSTKPLWRQIEDYALEHPGRVALTEPGQDLGRPLNRYLTYGELIRRAGFVASALRQNGIRPGSIVALVMERSLEMVIAILGVWKSGGAYCPVSPQYPRERINYIVRDSGAGFVLDTD